MLWVLTMIANITGVDPRPDLVMTPQGGDPHVLLYHLKDDIFESSTGADIIFGMI
jgi:hypothetical protein